MNPIFTKMVDAVEAANAARRKKPFIPQAFRRRALPSTRLCASALTSAANGKKQSAGNIVFRLIPLKKAAIVQSFKHFGMIEHIEKETAR